jgi:hypothetical protein
MSYSNIPSAGDSPLVSADGATQRAPTASNSSTVLTNEEGEEQISWRVAQRRASSHKRGSLNGSAASLVDSDPVDAENLLQPLPPPEGSPALGAHRSGHSGRAGARMSSPLLVGGHAANSASSTPPQTEEFFTVSMAQNAVLTRTTNDATQTDGSRVFDEVGHLFASVLPATHRNVTPRADTNSPVAGSTPELYVLRQGATCRGEFLPPTDLVGMTLVNGGEKLLTAQRFIGAAPSVKMLPEVDYTLCIADTGTPIALLKRFPLSLVAEEALNPSFGVKQDRCLIVRYAVTYLKQLAPRRATTPEVGSARSVYQEAARSKYHHGRRTRVLSLAVLGVARLMSMRKKSATGDVLPADDVAVGISNASTRHLATDPAPHPAAAMPVAKAAPINALLHNQLATIEVTFDMRAKKGSVEMTIQDGSVVLAENEAVRAKMPTDQLSGQLACLGPHISLALRNTEGAAFDMSFVSHRYECAYGHSVSHALALALGAVAMDVPTIHA